MALNNEQKRRSAYIARFTTTEGDLGGMDAERRARRYEGTVWYERYLQAYRRSDYEAMLNYYRAFYPAPPWMVDNSPIVPLEVPVLEFHGLDDHVIHRYILMPACGSGIAVLDLVDHVHAVGNPAKDGIAPALIGLAAMI